MIATRHLREANMSDHILKGRRAGLEEAFFAAENERLRQQLREADASSGRKAMLATASGIHDENVLARLVELEIGVDTLAALRLVPLILVAWADGTVSDQERLAVLRGAEAQGIAAGTPAHGMLESWLKTAPGAAMTTAWKDYVQALTTPLDPAARHAMATSMLEQARTVAQAAGGFMGFGSRISLSEQTVLGELQRAFHP